VRGLLLTLMPGGRLAPRRSSFFFFFDREWQITFTISFSFAEVQTWGESLEMLTIVQQTDARGMRFIWGLNQTVKYLQITL